MPDFYFVEEMNEPLFQIVSQDGDVLGKVDILSAEGLEYRYRKAGTQIEWVDRGSLKERKHVRNLISQFRARRSGVVPASL